MEEISQLKVSRNGSVRLPAAVRESAGIQAGDLLKLAVTNGVIELIKSEPDTHYAKWRSISHGLILEKQQESV